jgi:ABC-2 type transport system permease protein
MRGYALANARQSKFGILSLVSAALLGIVAAGASLLLGFTAPLAGGADQIALVLLTWAAGRVGFAAFSGADPAMPLDIFRTMPLERRALSRALLLLGVVDPSLFFLAIASGSLVVFGFRQTPGVGILAIFLALIYLAFVSEFSTIVSALVPAGSRRRQDAGTLVAAVVISAVVVTGTLTPALLSALAAGTAPALAIMLRLLPTGWGSLSLELAVAGDWWTALGVLVGFLVVCGALMVWWPSVLTRRLESQGGSGRRHLSKQRRRVLPSTPVGAVASRELRLWIRDPTRAGFLLIALIVGLGVCLVPLFSRGADILLPFAGIGTVVIAAAIAGNSYGFDGPAFALVLTTPASESADVRGRQLAWLLLIGPYSILLSLAGLLVAGNSGEWSWVLGLLPSTIGGAVGITIFVSAIAPQPLDDGGGPTPAWVIKAYVTLILTALSTGPALVFLIVGARTGVSWLSWLGVPVGVITGIVSATVLGSIARTRITHHGPEMLQALASSPAGRK